MAAPGEAGVNARGGFRAHPARPSPLGGGFAGASASLLHRRSVARIPNDCPLATPQPVQGCPAWFGNATGAADLGRQGGLVGPDGTLENNDFIAFIGAFFANDLPRADVGAQGGVPQGDTTLDNNDFVVFIGEFFAGC